MPPLPFNKMPYINIIRSDIVLSFCRLVENIKNNNGNYYSSEGVNTSTKSIPHISWSIKYNKSVSYILTAVGLVGNILSLIVLMLSPKRSNASRLYLIVLTV